MLPGLVLSAVLAAQPAPAAPPGPLPPTPAPALYQPAPTMPVSPAAYPPQQMAPAAPPILRDTHLGPPDSFWVGGDYLLYWLKPAQVPLLVAGNRPGLPSVPVIGGREHEFGPADGGRLYIGTWLNDRHTLGVQASGFLLEQKSAFAAVNSGPGGSPQLVRPFLDALLARPAELLVSDPGLLAGGAFLATGSRLSGADLTVIRNIAYCPNYSFDFLAGGKYLDLDEYLAITQVTRPIDGGVVVLDNVPYSGTGSVLTVADRFRTRNQFWGGVLGLRGEYRFGPAFVNLTVKGGVGNTRQEVDIDGFSAVSVAGVPRLPTGLLAVQGANNGRQVSNRLSVVSEVGAQVGVQVSRHLRVMIGYDLLYLESVARPGDQIDPIVNPRLLPTSTSFRQVSGLTSPIRTRARDDWYAHGIRLGAQLQY
ncbi:MAG TPA: BBP7 family outer membrane beta-barrel protein [Fimbriiglobus sp.]|nr:BBP7 family outer membrane beta-barrel protein [Fimbriiglobus sp.]